MSDIPHFTSVVARRDNNLSLAFNPAALLPHVAFALSAGFVALVLFGLV